MKFVFIGLFCLIVTTTASAAEWAMDANIKQELSYNDNVRMSENAQGSVVYKMTPVLNLRHDTLNSEFAGSVSYGIQRYSDISDLNSENQSYKLLAKYQTRSVNYAVNTRYDLAPARNSAESDTGNFSTNAEKTTRSVAPAISYQLTKRDTLSLAGNYSDSTYTSNEFADTENSSINLAWQQQWTTRYSGSISVFYSRFKSAGAEIETASDSYGINISTRYLLTKNWELTGNVGIRLTDTSSKQSSQFGDIATDNQSEGFLSDTGFNYQGENLTASLNLNRSLTPSGIGQLNEQTRLSLGLGYKLTERLSTELSSSYQSSKSASSNQSNQRTNITFQSSVSWRLTPDLFLTGSYRYRQQNNDNQENAVDSNTFMLILNYNWNGLSLAR